MKRIYGLVVAACLSLAACTTGTAGDTASAGDAKDPATTQVFHYNSQDVAALPLGEFLHFDVSDPNKVYAFEYSDPAELDHVMVHNGSDQYILGEQTAPANKVADGQKHEVAISADSALQPEIVTSCTCPCCLTNNGVTVCC